MSNSIDHPKRNCSYPGSYNETTIRNEMLDRCRYEEYLKLQKKYPSSKKVEKLTNFYRRTFFDTLLGKRRLLTQPTTNNYIKYDNRSSSRVEDKDILDTGNADRPNYGEVGPAKRDELIALNAISTLSCHEKSFDDVVVWSHDDQHGFLWTDIDQYCVIMYVKTVRDKYNVKYQQPSLFYFMAGYIKYLKVDNDGNQLDQDNNHNDIINVQELALMHIVTDTNINDSDIKFHDRLLKYYSSREFHLIENELVAFYKTHECNRCTTNPSYVRRGDELSNWENMSYFVKGMKRASFYKSFNTREFQMI